MLSYHDRLFVFASLVVSSQRATIIISFQRHRRREVFLSHCSLWIVLTCAPYLYSSEGATKLFTVTSVYSSIRSTSRFIFNMCDIQRVILGIQIPTASDNHLTFPLNVFVFNSTASILVPTTQFFWDLTWYYTAYFLNSTITEHAYANGDHQNRVTDNQ